jgi:methyltransferase (TIGR00027 family)
MMRALHRIIDVPPWVVDDAVSETLFGDIVRERLSEDPDWFGDASRTAVRGHVLVRTAFAEQRLREAVLRGARQCVVLGAGYDTFAYRQPSWMKGVRVFEVDTPQTQERKIERLARAGIFAPDNVVYAAIDFERTSLAEGLEQAGLDTAAMTFLSALGVFMYLSRDAVESIFRYVAAFPEGSEIAFTFSTPDGDPAVARRVAAAGEPILTRFDGLELERMLHALGFRIVKHLTSDEAHTYLGKRRDTLSTPRSHGIAAAIV